MKCADCHQSGLILPSDFGPADPVCRSCEYERMVPVRAKWLAEWPRDTPATREAFLAWLQKVDPRPRLEP